MCNRTKRRQTNSTKTIPQFKKIYICNSHLKEKLNEEF